MNGSSAMYRKFYAYQKERFPVAILALSLLPAALSSGAVVSSHPTMLQVFLVIAASVAYLFHIRVMDEHRDLGHDNEHHRNRPIQSGIITNEELQYADILAISIVILIAAIAGFSSLIIALAMFAYAYIAGKEFFIGEGIRKHFFLYNGVNLVQMLLMQLFVYSVFSNTVPLHALVLGHFLFTTTGTIIFEFVRKLKIPGDDGTGKDTYTHYLGFRGAMVIYLLLTLLNTILFWLVATQLSKNAVALIISSLLAFGIMSSTVVIHWVKKVKQTDQLMQLSFLLVYATFNLTIFFLAYL